MGHTPSPALCVIHWHCYPPPPSALQCTGDRLLETNSPTQGSRLLTACPVESKLCPRAILLYFPPRRRINLQTLTLTLIYLVRFPFRATIRVYNLQENWQAGHTFILLTPSSRANSHPTNTRSLLAGCNLLSACPALQTLQGGLLWGAPRACLRLPA